MGARGSKRNYGEYKQNDCAVRDSPSEGQEEKITEMRETEVTTRGREWMERKEGSVCIDCKFKGRKLGSVTVKGWCRSSGVG